MDNNNYWFLSFIPILFNFVPILFLSNAYRDNVEKFEPSLGVVFNLMFCFKALTQQAYYHRQPDEFIGASNSVFLFGVLGIPFTLAKQNEYEEWSWEGTTLAKDA